MSLQIGDIAPDFSAVTTQGPIQFHQWLGNSWGVLFSHPKDFTPVCTTELGYTERLRPEFEKRGVKVIGLSVDAVGDHERWADDIEATQGARPKFPLIGDADRKIANLYGMLHPKADNTHTVRSVFLIDPAGKVRLSLTYPKSAGRNFDEILRALDALQVGDSGPFSTPADWKAGERVIVAPTITTEDARARFKAVEEVKPYLRYAEAPSA